MTEAMLFVYSYLREFNRYSNWIESNRIKLNGINKTQSGTINAKRIGDQERLSPFEAQFLNNLDLRNSTLDIHVRLYSSIRDIILLESASLGVWSDSNSRRALPANTVLSLVLLPFSRFTCMWHESSVSPTAKCHLIFLFTRIQVGRLKDIILTVISKCFDKCCSLNMKNTQLPLVQRG